MRHSHTGSDRNTGKYVKRCFTRTVDPVLWIWILNCCFTCQSISWIMDSFFLNFMWVATNALDRNKNTWSHTNGAINPWLLQILFYEYWTVLLHCQIISGIMDSFFVILCEYWISGYFYICHSSSGKVLDARKDGYIRIYDKNKDTDKGYHQQWFWDGEYLVNRLVILHLLLFFKVMQEWRPNFKVVPGNAYREKYSRAWYPPCVMGYK